MSGGIAKGRLGEERKAWRKDHPIGFYAKPQVTEDGATNFFKWTAGIPGKTGTDWEGGVYQVLMEFSEEYPSRPPKCTSTMVGVHWFLVKPLHHPNCQLCICFTFCCCCCYQIR